MPGYATRVPARGPVGRLVRRHRAQIVAAAERIGAHSVSVFGSAARGEDGEASDLDLLVDLPDQVGVLAIYDLKDSLEGVAPELGGVDDRGMAVQAVKYELIVIGEAVGNLSEEARAREPGTPWGQVKGLRNLLAHEYVHVEVPVLLTILDEHLPGLEAAALRIEKWLAGTQECR